MVSNPVYKPFRPLPYLEDLLTMVINRIHPLGWSSKYGPIPFLFLPHVPTAALVRRWCVPLPAPTRSGVVSVDLTTREIFTWIPNMMFWPREVRWNTCYFWVSGIHVKSQGVYAQKRWLPSNKNTRYHTTTLKKNKLYMNLLAFRWET